MKYVIIHQSLDDHISYHISTNGWNRHPWTVILTEASWFDTFEEAQTYCDKYVGSTKVMGIGSFFVVSYDEAMVIGMMNS